MSYPVWDSFCKRGHREIHWSSREIVGCPICSLVCEIMELSQVDSNWMVCTGL